MEEAMLLLISLEVLERNIILQLIIDTQSQRLVYKMRIPKDQEILRREQEVVCREILLFHIEEFFL